MSEPLDDFNRRMTRGDTLGPPTNAAESAAQSFLDAQRRNAPPVGGGSIDFGAKAGVALLLGGFALFFFAANLVDKAQGGTALVGLVLALVSGILILFGGGALLVSTLRGAGNAARLLGMRSLLLAGTSLLIAWLAAPKVWSLLWSLGLVFPVWVIALAIAFVAFVALHRVAAAVARAP